MVEAVEDVLPPSLVEAVLSRLGLGAFPAVDVDGLRALYAAWCQRVPFDNVRKRIALEEGAAGPLPGDDPRDFLRAWLEHGTGGTCWAGAGALHALLGALGFRSRRGIATMLVAPDLPPNHGTVVVDLEATPWLVDASMLHGEPLVLTEGSGETAIGHGAWGIDARREERGWRVRWRPLHATEGLDCRIDALGVDSARFRALHEATRAWSPFNYALYIRCNRGESVVGAAYGSRVELAPDGGVQVGSLAREDRDRLLVETLGLSEAVVRRLPPDRTLPPPPGSRTARGEARD